MLTNKVQGKQKRKTNAFALKYANIMNAYIYIKKKYAKTAVGMTKKKRKKNFSHVIIIHIQCPCRLGCGMRAALGMKILLAALYISMFKH